ncbi:hypothetical protein IF1G_01271 [Cordyceps javanica]|uniref:Uncharacterized protein n=1 Tax=Cordyceps javanica TaxID=43265 RepID=A0A545VBE3_9HYPO|nr:hypothetical protein IF1G_01271 [Cordyceps javanica]
MSPATAVGLVGRNAPRPQKAEMLGVPANNASDGREVTTDQRVKMQADLGVSGLKASCGNGFRGCTQWLLLHDTGGARAALGAR